METAFFWASTALFLCAGSQTHLAAESPGAMTGQTFPMSPRLGGYGPVRLAMTRADAERVFNGIARDVVFLPTSADHPLTDMADNRLDQMVVMTPWVDVYVGRLDTNTLIQVGMHGGRVVSVMLRTRLAAQGQACRSAFLGLVKRNEVEFGPVPVADMPGNSRLISDGKVDFDGWTLRLGRIQAGATCNLTADYISNSDSKIEANWRARLP
ncbi:MULTISPECIES: hypothetical protein [unclassified Novosphingobium]|uniref:hypothetical protein n=1 Tax=unclassified Novosphingobium TaxID=2644732 RepID=UPI00135BAADD|nr:MULTISPECIES: hypothetical protein [unclassified Novosphingobium]